MGWIYVIMGETCHLLTWVRFIYLIWLISCSLGICLGWIFWPPTVYVLYRYKTLSWVPGNAWHGRTPRVHDIAINWWGPYAPQQKVNLVKVKTKGPDKRVSISKMCHHKMCLWQEIRLAQSVSHTSIHTKMCYQDILLLWYALQLSE